MSLPKSAFEKRKKAFEPPYPRSIIMDGIHPTEFNNLNVIYCCEQCSYFDSKKKSCAMGFRVEYHMRDAQLKTYARSGKMALCRSQEID
jgi:hypothetical protein